MNEILTASEVATLFKVSKWLVYQLTRENKLPVIRLGKAVRYRLSDLLQMVDNINNLQKS